MRKCEHDSRTLVSAVVWCALTAIVQFGSATSSATLATDLDCDRDPVDECERDLDREELELFRRCTLELEEENI